MKVGVWDRTEDVNKLKFGGKKLDEDDKFLVKIAGNPFKKKTCTQTNHL